MGTIWRTISLLLWLVAIPFAVVAALLLHFSDTAKHKSWRVEPLPFGLGWIYWGARRRTLEAFPSIKNLRKRPVHSWCMKQGQMFEERKWPTPYLRAKYAIATVIVGSRLLVYLASSRMISTTANNRNMDADPQHNNQETDYADAVGFMLSFVFIAIVAVSFWFLTRRIGI